MQKKFMHVVCAALIMFLMAGCSKSHNPVAPDQAPTTGQLLFALDAADNIASGTVTITKGHQTHVLPITITNHTGSVTFNSVQVGHWNIQVQLYDADGVEIYTGDGEAIVTKNTTTTVTIRVNHNTGTLVINVEVPGLLLWNKLGNQQEVENSEEGPNGLIDSGIEYLPCQYGNGFKSLARADHDMISNYIRYDNLQLSQKGCIEFWYKPNWSGPAVGHCVTLFEYGRVGDWYRITAQYNDWQDLFAFNITNQVNATGKAFIPNSTLGWSTSEPFHLAFTWDDSLTNPNERLKIFLNGTEVGAVNGDYGNPVLTDLTSDMSLILGCRTKIPGVGDWYRHPWEGNQDGVIDNLKIWNYPKTDFSDRFVE